MSELKPIVAPDGMVLTKEKTFSKKIYLGCNDREENWRLITDAEADKIQAEMWAEEEAEALQVVMLPEEVTT